MKHGVRVPVFVDSTGPLPSQTEHDPKDVPIEKRVPPSTPPKDGLQSPDSRSLQLSHHTRTDHSRSPLYPHPGYQRMSPQEYGTRQRRGLTKSPTHWLPKSRDFLMTSWQFLFKRLKTLNLGLQSG